MLPVAVGVAQDKDDDTVLKFMESRSLPWSCINIEGSRKLIQANNVNSYPTPILVDQSGRIVSMLASTMFPQASSPS